jgi:hypothetical protein
VRVQVLSSAGDLELESGGHRVQIERPVAAKVWVKAG